MSNKVNSAFPEGSHLAALGSASGAISSHPVVQNKTLSAPHLGGLSPFVARLPLSMQVPLHTPIYPPFNDPRAVLARPKRMGGEYSDQQIKRQRLNTPLPVSHLSNTALTMPAQQYSAFPIVDPNQQSAQFQGFSCDPTIYGPFQPIQEAFLQPPAVPQEMGGETLPALSNDFIPQLDDFFNRVVSVESLCADQNTEIAKLGRFLFEESPLPSLPVQDGFPPTSVVRQKMQIETVPIPLINGPIFSSVMSASQDMTPCFSVLESERKVPYEIALPFNEHEAQSSSLSDPISLQSGLQSRSKIVKKYRNKKRRDHIKEIRDPIIEKYLNNEIHGENFLKGVPENMSDLQKYLKNSLATDRGNIKDRVEKTVLFYLYRFFNEDKKRKLENFFISFNKCEGVSINTVCEYLYGVEKQSKLKSSNEDESKKKDLEGIIKYNKKYRNIIDEVQNSVMNKIKENELKKEGFSEYISKLQVSWNKGDIEVTKEKMEIILSFYFFHYKSEGKSKVNFFSDMMKNVSSIPRRSIKKYLDRF